jgi:hypothetical protein
MHPIGPLSCLGGCPIVLMGKGNNSGIVTSTTTIAMRQPGHYQQSHCCGLPRAIVNNKSLWSPPDERCARMSQACAGAPRARELLEEVVPPSHFCVSDATLSMPPDQCQY